MSVSRWTLICRLNLINSSLENVLIGALARMRFGIIVFLLSNDLMMVFLAVIDSKVPNACMSPMTCMISPGVYLGLVMSMSHQNILLNISSMA